MTMELWGAGCFGLVVGWVTYRTLRRSTSGGLSDLAAVIGAVGGGTITILFPAGTQLFAAYAIGLAVGFFGYVGSALLLASRTGNGGAVNEWLGTPSAGGSGRGSGRNPGTIPNGAPPPP